MIAERWVARGEVPTAKEARHVPISSRAAPSSRAATHPRSVLRVARPSEDSVLALPARFLSHSAAAARSVSLSPDCFPPPAYPLPYPPTQHNAHHNTTQIAAAENLFARSKIDSGPLPLRIGPLAAAVSDPQSLHAALRAAEKDKCVVAYHPAAFPLSLAVPSAVEEAWGRLLGNGKAGGRKPRKLRGRAVLAIRADAKSEDVLTAILQARGYGYTDTDCGMDIRGYPGGWLALVSRPLAACHPVVCNPLGASPM